MKPYCILIPFHNPWNWHTDYANQTARFLARSQTVVCFLWGDSVSLREIVAGRKSYTPIRRTGNLWRYQPIYLFPGKSIPACQLMNLFLNIICVYILCSYIAIRKSKTRLFWFFGYYDPTFLLLPPFFRHWKTIYDCVDIPTHPNPRISSYISDSERRIAKNAWIVFVNSELLLAHMQPIRPDAVRVPLGFRIEMFAHTNTRRTHIRNTHPVIGYIGSIDYRLNFRILDTLARRRPDWQFAFAGPRFTDHMSPEKTLFSARFFSRPNVTHVVLPFRSVPAFLSRCSIGIIPYDTDVPLSRYSFPMKIMEYFYMQKPVITSPMPELMRFVPWVTQADTPNHWIRAITQVQAHRLSPALRRQIRRIALANTWEKKLRTITAYMTKYDRITAISDPTAQPGEHL